MAEQTTVSVRILDKEYQVACGPDEVDELTASARYLDGQMRTIRDSGKVVGMDRVAVMAALNIAHDLLQARASQTAMTQQFDRRIAEISERVERALEQQKQLAL